MRRCLLTIALILTSLVSTANAADYGFTKHAVYGSFGFTNGGFALGADYEYTALRDFGVGGYVRMYQKDETRGVYGVTEFGAFIRPHFTKKAWDFYVSPGIGIISIDAVGTRPGDATTLGPTLAFGLLYDLNGTAALGIENMRTWVWGDKNYRGELFYTDDFMLHFRVSF